MKDRTKCISSLMYVASFACLVLFPNFIFNKHGLADELESEVSTKLHPASQIPDADIEQFVDQIEVATVAPNLDLKKVAPLPNPADVSPQNDLDENKKIESEATSTAVEDVAINPLPADKAESVERKKLIILGAEVPANTSTRLAWSPQVTISGLALPTPVLVINGKNPGPTLCLTSTIHGDELNGIEVVRRVMYDIEPKDLNGTLIGVPIVNLQGFQQGSRYLSDRRDLNRHFPGEANGSLASRIANSLFTEVISHCEFLIDIHTGSFRRTNLPQIRADMNNEKVSKFVEGFDNIAIVHHIGSPGMLRSEANIKGIIAVTMELGESLRIQEDQIAAGTHSVNSLLDKLEMYSRMFIWGEPEPAYYASRWLRVESGGILFTEMDLGDTVSEGDVLGVVTDPITNNRTELVSPIDGNIIGMAINQVVIPGFAAYHIGIESTHDEMTSPTSEYENVVIDGEVIDPE